MGTLVRRGQCNASYRTTYDGLIRWLLPASAPLTHAWRRSFFLSFYDGLMLSTLTQGVVHAGQCMKAEACPDLVHGGFPASMCVM